VDGEPTIVIAGDDNTPLRDDDKVLVSPISAPGVGSLAREADVDADCRGHLVAIAVKPRAEVFAGHASAGRCAEALFGR
jgi:hypothetical protein